MSAARSRGSRALAIAAFLCLALSDAPPSLVSAAWAQGLGQLQGGDSPLEINADQGIEWRRDSQQYIARGNARAARGELEVFADTLTAHYRPVAAGGTEIYQIDAEGNVRIVTPSERVYGDLGRYEVDRGLLILWGENLRLETAEDVVTARDSLEYWETRQLAVARGNAVAVRQDKRIRADLLTAYFERNADGDLQIDRIDGKGNVEIASPTEFARSDAGVYYANEQLATLTGSVRITRGENQLNGEFAEMNMATGVSRLLGGTPGSGGDQRVRGLLVPKRKPAAPEDS
ncbi:MAG: LptA/OstA family protein [Kiloniellales bacterium]